MSLRVGINGFGRMGRLGLRAGWGNPAYDIVHINEIAADADCMAHLLEFDSVHGRWDRAVAADGDRLLIDIRSRLQFLNGDFLLFGFRQARFEKEY